MRMLKLFIMTAAMLGMTAAVVPGKPPLDTRYFTPSEEVVTPYISWMKPATGKPLQVLFITPYKFLREPLEFAQRFGWQYRVFVFDRVEEFYSNDSANRSLYPGISLEDRLVSLEEAMKAPCDLIVFGPGKWKDLHIRAQYLILKKVKEGTGLMAYWTDWNVEDEYRQRATRKKIKPEFSNLVPVKGLPDFSGYKDFPGVMGRFFEFSQFGKGRITGMKLPAVWQQAFIPRPCGHLDFKLLNINRYLAEYDSYFTLFGQVFLWTANRAPEVRLSGQGAIQGDRKAQNTLKVTLTSPDERKVECVFALRDMQNGICQEERKKVQLVPGSNQVEMTLIPAPAGKYFADLLVQESGKTINFGSSFVELTSDPALSKIDVKDSWGRDEALSGSVWVTNKAGAVDGLAVLLTQKDMFGREVGRVRLDVGSLTPGNVKEVRFQLPVAAPLTVLQRLEARLVTANERETLDISSRLVTYWNLYPPDDFRIVMWGSVWTYVGSYVLNTLRESGFDTGLGSPPNMSLQAGFWLIPHGPRFWDKKTDWYPHPDIPNRTADDHVRLPCLNDPVYRQELRSQLTNLASRVRTYGGREINLGDENCFTGSRVELCFCDRCVNKFHEFLKNEYQSLENVNREYETDYKTFDEIKPVLLADVYKNPKLSPQWVDYRRHMEKTWVEIHDYSAKVIEEVIPNARVGHEGSESAINSFGYGSGDFYQMMQVMKFNCTYLRPFGTRAVFDFARPDTLLGASWDGGYGSTRSPEYQRYHPWRNLFWGANSIWIFTVDPTSPPYSAVASDLSFFDWFKPSVSAFLEIKSGLGKLLMNAKRENDRTAMLYSPSSVHAATLTQGFPDIEAILNNSASMLADSHRQFQIVSYRQVAEGILKTGGFKCLILPYAQALSPAECAEIKSFVKAGGSVVADLRPGVCDEHGKPYPQGALDEVFGIKQDTHKADAQKGEAVIQAPGYPQSLPVMYVDAGLQLTTGQSKGTVAKTPVLVLNRYGQGTAVLFNLTLSADYISTKAQLEKMKATMSLNAITLRHFLNAALDEVGMKAQLSFAPALDKLQSYRFTSGNNQYLGLLQELPEDVEKYELKEAKPLVRSKTVVTLAEKRHIYDMRKHCYLGYKEKITVEVLPSEAHAYSLLPYEVRQVELEMPGKVKRGEAVTIKMAVKTTGAEPGLHVFHVAFLDPDGKEAKHYARNVAAGKGQGESAITLALNDRPGKWRVQVTDVASGMTVEKKIEVVEN